MNIKIKLIDPSLPMPEYKTTGACAFDLYSRIDITIKPFTPTIVPLNFVVKIPKGYVLILSARSSLPKTNLFLGNGIGIIDQDYHGEEDEIGAFMVNYSKKSVKILRGKRLCQGTFVKIAKAEKFIKVTKMNTKSRGGFGSTGHT